MLYGLRDVLGIMYGVVHLADAPSIAPLRASEIDCVAFHPLVDEHAIVAIDCVDAL